MTTTRTHTRACLAFDIYQWLMSVRIMFASLICWWHKFIHPFLTGNDTAEMCRKLNDAPKNISEGLCCNKLSLNVLKAHYMAFSLRSRNINNLYVIIDNTSIGRVYYTKFLGVQVGAQLSWAVTLTAFHRCKGRSNKDTWWRNQMETFPALLAICAGNSPVPGEFPTLMFSVICAWINGWVNTGEAGDLRHHRVHYDVIVIVWVYSGFVIYVWTLAAF